MREIIAYGLCLATMTMSGQASAPTVQQAERIDELLQRPETKLQSSKIKVPTRAEEAEELRLIAQRAALDYAKDYFTFILEDAPQDRSDGEALAFYIYTYGVEKKDKRAPDILYTLEYQSHGNSFLLNYSPLDSSFEKKGEFNVLLVGIDDGTTTTGFVDNDNNGSLDHILTAGKEYSFDELDPASQHFYSEKYTKVLKDLRTDLKL